MKNNSVAKRLRAISLGGKPSMEDNGEGRVSATLQAPEDTVATGEAPGEDKDLTTKIVEVKEGHDVEVAETERTDNVPMVGAEVEDGKAAAVEGADISKKDLAPVVSTEARVEISMEGLSAGTKAVIRRFFGTPLYTGSLYEKVEKIDGEIKELEDMIAAVEKTKVATNVSQEGAKWEGVKADLKAGFGFMPDPDRPGKTKWQFFGSPARLAHAKATQLQELEEKKAKLEEKLKNLLLANKEKVSTESSEGDVSATLKPVDETPADGERAPGEDQDLSTKIVETGSMQPVESAETEVSGNVEEAETTVSQEGFGGGVLGFILGSFGGVYGGYANGAAESKKKEILKVAEQIKKIRREGLEAAKKDGKKISTQEEDSFANADTGKIIKGVLLGMVGANIYGAYVGSKLQNAERDLRKKYQELQELIEDEEAKGARPSQESGDAAEAAANFAEGAVAAAEAAAAAEAGASAAAEVQHDAVAADAVEDAAQEAGVAEVAGDEAAAVVADADPEPISSDDDSDALDGPGADDVALDDEIAGAEDQIEEEEQNLQTYEDAEVSVESLIDTLEAAQQTGGLTPSGARMFNVALETISKSLTGESLPVGLVPSLEAYGGTETRMNSTNVSMEAAGSWWEKILEAIRQTFQVLKQWAQKFIKMLFDKSERVLRRAKGVRAKASQAKGGQLKAGGWASAIAYEGKVDLNGLQALPQIVEDISKRGGEGVAGYAALVDAIKNLAAANGDAEHGAALLEMPDIKRILANARGPLFKVESNADGKVTDGKVFSTDVLPGNVRFELEIHDLNFGKMGDASVMDGMKGGWKAGQWPKVSKHSIDAERPTEVRGLTSAEVNTVATRVITVVEQVRRVRNQIAEAEKADAAVLQIRAQEGAERGQRMMLWMQIKGAEGLRKMIANNQAVMLKYVIGVAEGYVAYAEASTGGAAAEAPAASEGAAAAAGPKALPAPAAA